jgi:hypothetical protein
VQKSRRQITSYRLFHRKSQRHLWIHWTKQQKQFFHFFTNFSVYVVFKGTEPLNLRNWISNIRIAPVVPFPGVPHAKVHSGFWRDYLKIHPELVKALQKYPPNKKIVFVGHSRGGALAAVAAISISKLGYKERVEFMGFGMPRIGNEAFAKYFKENIPKSWRIVNQKDIGKALFKLTNFTVSRLPPTLLGFHHFAQEAWFPKNGRDYSICSGTNGEDRKCSRGVLLPHSIPDHITYMDVALTRGFGKNRCGNLI